MWHSGTAAVVKIILFWVCFWLILTGVNQLPLIANNDLGKTVTAGIAVLAILILVLGVLKMEGETCRDVGLGLTSNWLPQLSLGVGMGVMLVASMILLLLLFTPLEIEASGNSDVLAVLGTSLMTVFLLALMEELAFRSYPLFRLQQIWGIRPAIYVTSIVFALYHGMAFDNLLGPGVWGLLFAWMAISTNSIALPTGFHLGANWLQALIGMKPQYSESIWELSIGPGDGLVDIEKFGLVMQVFLLIVGVLLIENLVAKRRHCTES